MVLERIKIRSLRCYDQADIEVDPKFNAIVGLNGQGKTSLLEAIGLLAFFRSFRAAKNQEILRLESEEGRVSGTVFHEDLRYELSVKVWPHRKQASFNGKNCKLLSNYVGKLSAVSFSPVDLEIIRGAPENRRNWVDRIAQIYFSEHVDLTSEYQKVLRHRNRLLKEAIENRGRLNDDFELWTDQLCDLGAKIIANRVDAANQITPSIRAHYETLSKKKTHIIIKYLGADFGKEQSGQNSPAQGTFWITEQVREMLKAGLRKTLQRDMILGTTSMGPHRDDLELRMSGSPVKAFGSQGEVRSLVLAMRLAEVEKQKETKGYSPLLLIDDFSSELDANRRKFLLDYLIDSGSQVFLTTTEETRLGKVFAVKEGRISSHDNGFSKDRHQQL
ncbi:MAG: DNA replication/repair protein RecF [Deltaproteobacteria bacterium]|nr:DNA replication/repair protein RecF [Deltaproteobacteria bacterium]